MEDTEYDLCNSKLQRIITMVNVVPLDLLSLRQFSIKNLWNRIAEATTRYGGQNVSAITNISSKQVTRSSDQGSTRECVSLSDIEEDLNKFKPIQCGEVAPEIVHVFALLYARTVVLVRDGLVRFWNTDVDGLFRVFLHFNDNESDESRTKKEWKIRPVLQTVEKTFRRGYLLEKVISLD
ncbi:Hypothetical protein PHPALM_8769 [Phytophthora palmivora]|uniref:Uncharacterized protein n=1 Tax=Phytophthora palmivora TaxID=4796 RepID=A0A2P4Y904_9STRA|nr:Hypothetical protein PHPALM_8769 [Phytophthora palmivora]